MTKAYFVNHANAIIHEDGSLTALRPVQTNIDWIYIAPEDMEITYYNSEKDQVTKSVKNGDMIIQMYDRHEIEGYQHIIVVTSEEWKNNLELLINKRNIQLSEDTPTCDSDN